jgi:hypothetical protein
MNEDNDKSAAAIKGLEAVDLVIVEHILPRTKERGGRTNWALVAMGIPRLIVATDQWEGFAEFNCGIPHVRFDASSVTPAELAASFEKMMGLPSDSEMSPEDIDSAMYYIKAHPEKFERTYPL